MSALRLFHFTCDHGNAGIDKDGVIRPGADGFVWLTDLRPGLLGLEQIRHALGLTSHTLTCDRMAYCWRVEAPDAVRFDEWAMDGVTQLKGWALGLTMAPGVMPRHWFLSDRPVPVVRMAVAS